MAGSLVTGLGSQFTGSQPSIYIPQDIKIESGNGVRGGGGGGCSEMGHG